MKITCLKGLLIKIFIKNNFEGSTKIAFKKGFTKVLQTWAKFL